MSRPLDRFNAASDVLEGGFEEGLVTLVLASHVGEPALGGFAQRVESFERQPNEASRR